MSVCVPQVEKNIMALDGSPTDLIKSGKSATDIANLLSEGLREGEIYPPEIIKPRFTCKCSMEKVISALDLLGLRCLHQASLNPHDNSSTTMYPRSPKYLTHTPNPKTQNPNPTPGVPHRGAAAQV